MVAYQTQLFLLAPGGGAQFGRGFQISWRCQLKTIDEEFDAVHVFCFEALALQDSIPTLAQVILWNFLAWKQKYTNNIQEETHIEYIHIYHMCVLSLLDFKTHTSPIQWHDALQRLERLLDLGWRHIHPRPNSEAIEHDSLLCTNSPLAQSHANGHDELDLQGRLTGPIQSVGSVRVQSVWPLKLKIEVLPVSMIDWLDLLAMSSAPDDRLYLYLNFEGSKILCPNGP